MPPPIWLMAWLAPASGPFQRRHPYGSSISTGSDPVIGDGGKLVEEGGFDGSWLTVGGLPGSLVCVITGAVAGGYLLQCHLPL